MKSTVVLVLLLGLTAALDDWDSTFARYNPNLKPSNTTTVRVNTYVRSVKNVNTQDRNWEVQLTFRQQWREPLLAHTSNERYKSISKDSVWTPDLFFSNELEGHFHHLLKDNSLVRVYPNGDVLFSERVSLTLSCPMNLKFFPYDKQICCILMASYGFTTNEVVFLWKEGDPVQVTKNLHLPMFTLERFDQDYCTSKTNTGEYSCLRADFTFRREPQRYLKQIIIPLTMMAFLAWLALFVRDSAIRVSILMFSLSLAIVGYSVNHHLMPTVSYNTIMDCLLDFVIAFIFAVIVETIVVIRIRRSQEFSEKIDIAEKIDRVCRILYFVVLVGYLILWFSFGPNRSEED